MGPGLQLLGLAWLSLHMLIVHYSGSFTARHLMYEPGTLIAVAGLMVTLICVPVAIEVAQATDEEVAIPVYEANEVEEATRPHHHARPQAR
jgi:hypothetical protein